MGSGLLPGFLTSLLKRGVRLEKTDVIWEPFYRRFLEFRQQLEMIF
jgi:hypothetical protein